MTELAHADDGSRVLGGLNYLGLLLGLAAVAGILTAAMTMQYAFGELPCPLCLLQRVALFGFCFGTMLSFRWGFSWRNSGISLLCAVLLLVVSVRQTLLDIYPRPGHAYIGSAVLGLHMPVWSVLIALALVFAQAIQLVLFGGRRVQHQPVTAFPAIEVAAKILGLFVVVLCAINFASVVLQCGLGECHTFGYELLSPAANP
jgi:disulfide bond formation protein DsbB